MTAELGPFRSVLDEAFDPPAPVEEMVGIYGPDWTGGLSSVEFVRQQRDHGWTPPPLADSIYYTDRCGHRDELAYEADLEHAAALRRVADEIRADHDTTYPQHARPAKKRRPKKTAAKT